MFDRHLSRHLAPYLDGKLPDELRRRADEHLARCERCSAELDEVRLGIGIVAQLRLVEAPETVWRSIIRELDGVEHRAASPLRMWRFAAAMAVVLVAAGVTLYNSQPAGEQWEVTRVSGAPAVGSRRIAGETRVGAGEWIETDDGSRARIKVGVIGSVQVDPNTQLQILVARPGEHRLALRSGQISASISAPPRLFFVETPAGTAIDMGCQYELRCDRAGEGLLHVTAGWVSYQRDGRESLVPAGAVCHTRPRIGPGTPYFEDASAALAGALVSFDFQGGGTLALNVVLSEARVRDTLTLWHLLSRANPQDRGRVYDRMANLSPPPPGIQRDQILQLDPAALQRWREELAWTW